MIGLHIHVYPPQIHYITLPQKIWYHIKVCIGRWQYVILLPATSPSPTALTIASITILGHNKYILMSNIHYITSPMVPNKLGYMILISIPIQHPMQYYQPLVGYIIVLLSFTTHYRTYVWHTTCLMSITMLYSIPIHPFLLLPLPKCLLVHQLCRDWPVNWFLISFVVYLLLINIFVTSNVTELCLWVS